MAFGVIETSPRSCHHVMDLYQVEGAQLLHNAIKEVSGVSSNPTSSRVLGLSGYSWKIKSSFTKLLEVLVHQVGGNRLGRHNSIVLLVL
jgi:hypothetical protein